MKLKANCKEIMEKRKPKMENAESKIKNNRK